MHNSPGIDIAVPGDGMTEGPARRAYQLEFVECALEGNVYFLPAYSIDRPAVKCFLEGKVYEPETHALVRHVFSRLKGSMIHAGTFFGDMIPSFAAAAETLWCFEPVLENYVLARLSIERNGLDNVNLFNAALSDTVGHVRIDTVSQGGIHRGGSSFVAETGVTCPAMKLDQFEYADLRILQLDVEDHELPALQGAVETIRQHKPLIMVEDRAETCAAFLGGMGYVNVGALPNLNIWLDPTNTAVELALRA